MNGGIPMDINQFLKEKVESKEVITVAYEGGSTPGRERELMILSYKGDKIVAREIRPLKKGKQDYLVSRIKWVKDSFGKEIINNQQSKDTDDIFPYLPSIEAYAEHFGPDFEKADWVMKQTNKHLGLHGVYGNGNARKKPSVLIRFIEKRIESVLDEETNDVMDVELISKHPYRVDSWQFRRGISFKNLRAAMKRFISEVEESDPKNAKSITPRL